MLIIGKFLYIVKNFILIQGDDIMEKDFDFLKVGMNNDIIDEMPKEIAIEYKKKLNKFLSTARKEAKLEKCFYCKEEKSSFCNSHSIPAFCLKNIATDGNLYYSNKLNNIPFIDYEKGVNKSGTFQLICRECDGKIFQEYENPDNYNKEPTPKMLAQIAMKNNLKKISKRLNEYYLYDIVAKEAPHMGGLRDAMQEVEKMDLKEDIQDFEKAKRLSKKNWEGEYYLFYYEKLDYVVPIAFQSSIALVTDLEGNIINDIYCPKEEHRMKDLHICIFPLKDSSVIMMFIDSKHKRYRKFYKQFNKLALVNYIIFLYSEDIFFSKEISDEVLENSNLINVAQQTSMFMTIDQSINAIEKAKSIYDLGKRDDIPNLLSKDYKLI